MSMASVTLCVSARCSWKQEAPSLLFGWTLSVAFKMTSGDPGLWQGKEKDLGKRIGFMFVIIIPLYNMKREFRIGQ